MLAAPGADPVPPPTSNQSVSANATVPTTAQTSSKKVDELIQQLADPDPVIRSDGHRQLIALGESARPRLQEAASGDDPQVSEAARDVLTALPWFEPTDPPMVIDLLRNYGNGTVADRIGIIGHLGELIGEQPVLMRLLQREPNQDVCWRIAAEIRKSPLPETLTDIRNLDPASGGSASHFLCGAAWLTPLPHATPLVDQARGRRLFEKAIEMELATPSYDDGQLDEAFDELAGDAVYHDQLLDALRLRREQSRRIGVDRDTFPSPFFSLLAIYAQGASLDELAEDLKTFDRFLFRPEACGTLSQTYRRVGMNMMADTLEQCAFDTALTPETQYLSGECFDRLGYSELCAAQFRSILTEKALGEQAWNVQARLHLSQLASVRDDDAMALSQLQSLLDDRKTEELTGLGVEELQQLAVVHELKIAVAANDREAMERCLSALPLAKPVDTDTCIAVVPGLRKLGRDAEATQVFDAAYHPLKEQIDQGNTDPSMLNETAWLCARCNMHLAEAMKWAGDAVRERPASPALLDTEAEVYFRSGRPAEAAAFERRALTFDPGDLFMHAQLKRFESAAATQPAPPSHAVEPR